MRVIIAITMLGVLFAVQDTVKVVEYYMTGKVKTNGMKVNSFKHGKLVHYDSNGHISKLIKYNYGKKVEVIDVGQAFNK